MVSVDATSLFISILKELAETAVRESLSQLLDYSSTDLKNEHLLDIMKLCMKAFFTFQGQPYEQIKGTPMGSPISRYIAEIVLQTLEAAAFETQKPSNWVCYVDDTFVIIKSGRQAVFKAHLNSILMDIQFTMETHCSTPESKKKNSVTSIDKFPLKGSFVQKTEHMASNPIYRQHLRSSRPSSQSTRNRSCPSSSRNLAQRTDDNQRSKDNQKVINHLQGSVQGLFQ